MIIMTINDLDGLCRIHAIAFPCLTWPTSRRLDWSMITVVQYWRRKTGGREIHQFVLLLERARIIHVYSILFNPIANLAELPRRTQHVMVDI
jgi:hypothetical protein